MAVHIYGVVDSGSVDTAVADAKTDSERKGATRAAIKAATNSIAEYRVSTGVVGISTVNSIPQERRDGNSNGNRKKII